MSMTLAGVSIVAARSAHWCKIPEIGHSVDSGSSNSKASSAAHAGSLLPYRFTSN
jgi:hypothetical protein